MGKNKAFKNRPHNDLSAFGNRLWALMENVYDNPKDLATVLYDSGLVKVNSYRAAYNEEWVTRKNAIGSITKKIEAHLNATEVDDAQGEMIRAYCSVFHCSADYLFGFTPVKSGDIEIRRICERTGLSEKAVQNLAQQLDDRIVPTHISLIWSRLLESELFFYLPSDWRAAYQEACEIIKCEAAAQAIADALKEGKLQGIEEAMLAENIKMAAKKKQEHYAAYHGMLYKLSQDITEALGSLTKVQTEKERVYDRAYSNILKQYRRKIAALKGESLPPEPDDEHFEWNVHIL